MFFGVWIYACSNLSVAPPSIILRAPSPILKKSRAFPLSLNVGGRGEQEHEHEMSDDPHSPLLYTAPHMRVGRERKPNAHDTLVHPPPCPPKTKSPSSISFGRCVSQQAYRPQSKLSIVKLVKPGAVITEEPANGLEFGLVLVLGAELVGALAGSS